MDSRTIQPLTSPAGNIFIVYEKTIFFFIYIHESFLFVDILFQSCCDIDLIPIF